MQEIGRCRGKYRYLSGLTCAIIRGNGNSTASILAAVSALSGDQCCGLRDHDADHIGHLAGCEWKALRQSDADAGCDGPDPEPASDRHGYCSSLPDSVYVHCQTGRYAFVHREGTWHHARRTDGCEWIARCQSSGRRAGAGDPDCRSGRAHRDTRSFGSATDAIVTRTINRRDHSWRGGCRGP